MQFFSCFHKSVLLVWLLSKVAHARATLSKKNCGSGSQHIELICSSSDVVLVGEAGSMCKFFLSEQCRFSCSTFCSFLSDVFFSVL